MLVYPKDISVTGQNFQDDQMTKNVWWKDNRLGEKEALYHILLHVLLFGGAMKVSILCLNFRHISKKQLT